MRDFFILIILILFSTLTFGQIDKKGICKISDTRINFYLDTKWTEDEKREVSESFDLDTILLSKAYSLIPEFSFDSVEWEVKKINNRIIELSKDLNLTSFETIENYEYETVDIEKLMAQVYDDLNAKGKSDLFGINDFSNENVFHFENDTAVFFLPGHSNAEQVFLSGNFNDWSTMQNPMQFVDSGWMLKLPLEPNKYIYKYIIDGKWAVDPNNRKSQQNEHGTYNSVLYCTNHIFRLNGYTKKRKVFLAGSFNNWKPDELRMKPDDNGWYLPVWLKDGEHTYKFIVNGTWMIDSVNPIRRDDGMGNINSVLELGEKYTFFVKAYEEAEKMILTGNFNNWNEHELLMTKNDSGWVYNYTLGPGMYEYKFIADGNWIIDKNNPYTIGQGVNINSVLIFKPNYTFVLNGYQDAENVCVSGTFNNWNPEGFPMKKEGSRWIFPAYLNKGKQLYKFIIDGEWIIDPDNPLWEDNQYGTDNSVLWID